MDRAAAAIGAIQQGRRMSILEIRGLTKRFAGLIAVNDVSFDVPRGSITALIGPNGAGKTTCFNMIAGAMPASAGSVAFAGKSIAGLAPETLCRLGMARTFQIMRPLSGMKVVENVIVGALSRESSVTQARLSALAILDRVGLVAKADHSAAALTLPDRKLLELAKALSTQPRLLMLDEVMAALRPADTDHIVSLLRALRQDGITILLIEHVMRVVMALADKVVVLHHGEKIAEGPPGAVVQDQRVIESYLGRRAKVA
jgi:branched-chain amino acid transport system ATP-binding protein